MAGGYERKKRKKFRLIFRVPLSKKPPLSRSSRLLGSMFRQHNHTRLPVVVSPSLLIVPYDTIVSCVVYSYWTNSSFPWLYRLCCYSKRVYSMAVVSDVVRRERSHKRFWYRLAWFPHKGKSGQFRTGYTRVVVGCIQSRRNRGKGRSVMQSVGCIGLR